MDRNHPAWQPHYTLTPAIARRLMAIEGARAVVERTPLPHAAQAELRRRARIRSTHYSTCMESNRLTLTEAEQVIEGRAWRSTTQRIWPGITKHWPCIPITTITRAAPKPI